MADVSPAKWLIILLLLGLFSFVSVTPAVAQTKAGQIVISPAFQEITITEGQATASGSIELQNQSQSDQQFTLNALEIQQFDTEGNVSFKDKPVDSQNANQASFITLTESQVTLAAGQTKKIPFTVFNPVSLSPGGHYAALVAKLQTTQSQNQVLSALSAFILVRKVGGEQFNLSLTTTTIPQPIWWKIPRTADLTFSNQGNVHLVPRGNITITDFFGRLIAQGTVNENSLYIFPGTQRVVNQKIIPVALAIPGVPLKLSLTGHSQPGQIVFTQQSWVLYLPPLLPLVLIGSTVLLAFIIYRHRHHAPPAP